MPLDLKILANDFWQVSKDLPVSFRFRRKVYNDASFSPGELGFDPVTGGIIEDTGTATLMYAVCDLPKDLPEFDEEIEVLWHRHWIKFVIHDTLFGHAVATLTLTCPEK